VDLSLSFRNILSARFCAAIAAFHQPNMSSNQRIITDNNKSPLIQVLSLMFLVIAILACLVRTGTKLYMIKTVRVDDILIIAATVRHPSHFMHSQHAYIYALRYLRLVKLRLSLMRASMDSANISRFSAPVIETPSSR
jgi:hypothetical protein